MESEDISQEANTGLKKAGTNSPPTGSGVGGSLLSVGPD